MKFFLPKKVLWSSVIIFLLGEFFFDFFDNCKECFHNFNYVQDIIKGSVKGILFYFVLALIIRVHKKIKKH